MQKVNILWLSFSRLFLSKLLYVYVWNVHSRKNKEKEKEKYAYKEIERVGSIVVDYKLPSDADKRPPDPYYYCLKCGECSKRCPVDAIRSDDPTNGTIHDKNTCANHVFSAIPYIKKNYGFTIYGCGLCQVGVPCENTLPKGKTPYQGPNPYQARSKNWILKKSNNFFFT